MRRLLACLALLALPGCGPESRDAAPSAASGLMFRNIAAEAGLAFTLGHGGRSPLDIKEITGHGLAALDHDGDGDPDLLFLGPDRVALFRNDGGRFTDVTQGAGLPRKGYWVGVAAGDFDNDGDADLFLTGWRCRALLRNNGGRFTDVTAAAGLPPETGWGSSAGFVDLDHDGLLDLVGLRYVEFGPSSRRFCREDTNEITCAPAVYPAERFSVYRQTAPGRFTDWTRRWGFDRTAGRGLGLVPLDYDDDGWTDLYVANDTEPGDLFRSLEGKRFENVAFRTGTALADNGKALGGMGLDAQDYDRDGRIDLAISTYEAEPKCLWRNVDGVRFSDRSAAVGLEALRPLVGWGMALEDFDLDGWRDLIYAHGHIVLGRVDPGFSYPQPLRLFRQEAGQFLDVTAGLPPDLREPFVGRGAALADFDGDGRLDVAISNMEGPARLLRNETPARGRWLRVRLIGRASNRMGLGARVTVTVGSERWVAEAKTARSIFAASDPALHFGLGPVTGSLSVTVRWPSGRTTNTEVPGADREIAIEEQ